VLKAEKPKSEAYPTELKTYGDHLRARRLDLGLLQKQVADQIRVDVTSVYNWESNRVEPAVRLIPPIIQFLSYCPYTPGLSFSGKFKLWRQSLGLSQEGVAKAIGVDEGTWRRWETGERAPTGKYLERIHCVIDLLALSSSSGKGWL
jgi:transcriptional regulator with XRE-family HTH domain